MDGSRHRWFCDDRWYDLLVVLDDATSDIYYAQLVERESTRTVLQALREVVAQRGVFCALYSDRASHFFLTPQAGEAVDRERVTQVGRALKERGIQRIAAYSPQARGRSERSFSTGQGRLPQELRLAGISKGGGGPWLPARALHRGVQPPLRHPAGPTRQRISLRSPPRPAAGLRHPAGAGGQPGQYRRGGKSLLADRQDPLAGHPGWLPGHRL